MKELVLSSAMLEALGDDQLIEIAWRTAKLRHKLRPHQRAVYDKYRRWVALPPANDGEMPLVFVLDISRRWGKTFLCLLIKIEDCLREPGSQHTYACAFNKDIGEIVRPLFDEIVADSPEDMTPEFRLSSGGRNMGYFFPNGSVLKLVGIDVNPKGLRGRGSSGFVVSEAGHVKGLETTVRSKVMPQFVGFPNARMILESNAPEDFDHDFDRVFVPDAKIRGAYHFGTIDDNTSMTEEERQIQIRSSGRHANRELYGIRERDPQKVVVPEFNDRLHVFELPTPEWAHAYVSSDPGSRDLFALLFGYWHYEAQKLVIQDEWAERNASTRTVADVIKKKELELWGPKCPHPSPGQKGVSCHACRKLPGLRYGDQDVFVRDNPYRRVTDIDHKLLIDMREEHGVDITHTRKDDAYSAETALRDAIGAGTVVVHPRCVNLIAHLNAARRNKMGTDWERSDQFGHFDLLAALIYMWRNVSKHADPKPLILPASAESGMAYIPANAQERKRDRVLVDMTNYRQWR